MQKRIQTIDIFRAITMLLMIFVNDFWSLNGIPSWLEHSAADQDFLGFSDIIFPCFLFIVGMSIPYAIRKRLAEGETHSRIAYHIILRSLALLVMGFFTVNAESFNSEAAGLSKSLFQVLMVLAFFLVWNVYPGTNKKYLFAGLQAAGAIILVLLLVIYRGGEGGDSHMTPQWWGILGLIGWTYLVSALVYLFARKSNITLLIIWILFIVENIAEHLHWLSLPLPGGGALQGFAFAGILASILLDQAEKLGKQKLLPVFFLASGLLFLLAGLVSRNYFIISKIQSTPTWVFLCNGIAFGFLALLYFIVEIKGKSSWFLVVKPAGTSTLTCYLIPYVYYSIAVYTFTLPVFLQTGIVGLLKSFLYSFLIIGITALLGKMNIRLKI